MPSRTIIIVICAAAAVLVGGGVATVVRESDRPGPVMTAKGQVLLNRGIHDAGLGGCYVDKTRSPDAQADAPVTIRNETGVIVATGKLGAGIALRDEGCEFPIRVEGVPVGSASFTVAIGDGDPTTVSAESLFSEFTLYPH